MALNDMGKHQALCICVWWFLCLLWSCMQHCMLLVQWNQIFGGSPTDGLPPAFLFLRQPQGTTTLSHFAESVVRFVDKRCVDGTTQEVTPHPPTPSSDPRSGTTLPGSDWLAAEHQLWLTCADIHLIILFSTFHILSLLLLHL